MKALLMGKQEDYVIEVKGPGQVSGPGAVLLA